jgi:hypothetical protein
MSPHYIGSIIKDLQSYSAQLQKLAEANCNGDFNNREDEYDRKVDRIKAKLDSIATLFHGMTFNTQGDPRGCVLYMKIAGVDGDAWDRERGFGIY